MSQVQIQLNVDKITTLFKNNNRTNLLQKKNSPSFNIFLVFCKYFLPATLSHINFANIEIFAILNKLKENWVNRYINN